MASDAPVLQDAAALAHAPRCVKPAASCTDHADGTANAKANGPSGTTGFAKLDAERFPSFAPGSIWLTGAGPGAPGLLTLL
ncbi:MAG: hypothetical protein AAGF32_02420, partial [Pseudomonadota bacterium]